MWMLTSLAILVSAALSEATTFGCTNSLLTDQARQMFYDAHNDARRSMAKGLEPNKCGRLPAGKNVYEMRWDCDMEQKIQDHLAGCPSTTVPGEATWSQNAAFASGTIPDPLAYSATAVNNWWQVVRVNGLNDPDNKYTGSGSGLYSFTNMAFGKTSAFACTYVACAGKLNIVCAYNKITYYTNGIIYDKGTACASDSECTTYPNSVCNDGLCFLPPQPPLVETFTQCPGETGISDQARNAFLNAHNRLRSSVAKGLEADGFAAGTFAPQAKQMIKMRYNCSVEASAKSWSGNCQWQHSTPAQRPGLGENMYQTSLLNADKIQTGEDASVAWWSELKDFGVGPDNILTNAVFDRGVGHYTQMAWETSTELGCFVQYCPSMTFTVCQYGPAGNMLDSLIYTKGAPCTTNADCPGTQTCSVSEALCVI